MPKKKMTAVPRLRFPEFRNAGPWRIKKIDDYFDVRSSKRVLQKDWQVEGVPFYRTRELVSLSKNEPFNSEVYISEELFSELADKYGLPAEGDFLVSGVGTLGIAYQVKAGDRFYFKDGNVLWLHRKTDINSSFFGYFFDSPFVQKQIKGGASISTVGTYTIEKARKTTFACPPTKDEQQKIADCLSSLDELTRAEEARLAALQAHKKGLMQQLFPVDGETTPRLRFPEFRNAGPWEVKPLQVALEYEQPGPFIVSSEHYGGSGTPVLTAGKTFILGYTSENLGIYDRVPVIIFDDFTTESKYVDFPFKIKSSAIKILSEKPGYSLKFVHELMSLIQFDASQHKRHWIGEYQHLRMPIPSYEEQQKIADCLASLDELIRAEKGQLAALQAHKKGLMQQLFPQEVD